MEAQTNNKRKSFRESNQNNIREKIRSNFIAPFTEVEKRSSVKNRLYNTKSGNNFNKNRESDADLDEEDQSSKFDENTTNFELELKRRGNKKEYIMGLFHRPIFAELYFAWCKDCSESISVENAKYFRDELSRPFNC